MLKTLVIQRKPCRVVDYPEIALTTFGSARYFYRRSSVPPLSLSLCDLIFLWYQYFRFDFTLSMLRCSIEIAYLDLLSYITDHHCHHDARVASTSCLLQVQPCTQKIF